jgi:hypothetical protein
MVINSSDMGGNIVYPELVVFAIVPMCSPCKDGVKLESSIVAKHCVFPVAAYTISLVLRPLLSKNRSSPMFLERLMSGA